MRRCLYFGSLVMTLAFSAAAQQQSDKNIAEVARANREARLRKAVEEAVDEMCAHASEPKAQETYPKIQERCKDKPALIQVAFEAALKKLKEATEEDVKRLQDGDTSWVARAGGITAQNGTTQNGIPPSSSQRDLQSLQTMLDSLSGKTPRELAEEFARDIQFPARPAWEQRLAEARDRLVARTQVVIDLMRSGAASGAVNNALADMKLAQIRYSDVQAEGISQAADWERKTAR